MKKLIVRREAVLHNIAEIQKRTQGTLWGVVKYDGYGMGLLFMAGVLREAGIHHLAVSEIEDILRLRQEGFLQETILCMRSTGIPQEAEEVVRLGSHISQLRRILADGSQPQGKKLDFLVQEMNREANTIGSKANDLEITSCVLEIKSEIEKIREQVQNIE